MASPRLRPSSIEPLESRIAPALLVNGANLLGGAGNPNTGDTSLGGNAVTLVKVLSGTALVWFQDGTITGISYGPNTSLEITGDVQGDLISNLTAAGRLSDSDNNPLNGDDGNVLLANNLVGLKTFSLAEQSGAINNIISGGSVSNFEISGRVAGIYAGDGAFLAESEAASGGIVTSTVGFDVDPLSLGVQSSFTLQLSTSTPLPGASISNGTLQTAFELQMFAGSGGLGKVSTGIGLAGGDIQNLTIVSAFIDSTSSGTTPSYQLIAGNGGDGISGGKGGSISNVLEKASNGTVKITAGNGGNGSIKAGGAGGNISGLEMLSDSSNYVLQAGNGGQGVGGGAGGSAVNNSFANRTPTNSIVLTANFTSLDGDDGGFDDVVFIDSSTGSLVVTKNVGGGLSFPKVVQKTDSNLNPIVTVEALGTTPVDALVNDVNSDGLPDIVVAYKNSNNLGFYLNDGHGVFYDINTGDVNGFTSSLSFSPTLIAKDFFSTSSTSFAVIGNEGGKSVAHSVTRVTAQDYKTSQFSTELGRLVTDLVTTNSGLYAGCQDGTVLWLTPTLDPNIQPYSSALTGKTVIGGVSNLDVDSTGDNLLALSSANKNIDVFSVAANGSLSLTTSIDASAKTGRPLIAHFVADPASDYIGVISTLTDGSRFDLYAPTVVGLSTSYSVDKSNNTQPVLKNFAVTGGASSPGFAFLGGSLSQFYFSRTVLDLGTYSLPFSGKRLSITSGNGGDAFDLGKTLGKAGAGGDINGLNADSNDIDLVAGNGGNSNNGPGGNGGSVNNPLSFTSTSGSVISPKITADQTLSIQVGNGGSPQGTGSKLASGGNSGSISGLDLTLGTGEVQLSTGDGGDGKGGKGGNGGNISGVTVKALDGSLTLVTGKGGAATSGVVAGGNGGTVSNFSFTLSLAPEVEALENPYFVDISTGGGGDSTQGVAGAGGFITNVNLKLDGADRTYDDPNHAPPLSDSHRDSTVSISIATGAGGNGATGGAGGSISGFVSKSIFDQKLSDGSIVLNYVTMDMSTGKGGTGSTGNGGNGGNISIGAAGLSGITSYDPDSASFGNCPMIVTAGGGGNGAQKGGLGGSITNLLARNALFGEAAAISGTQLSGGLITAGTGGNGTALDGGKGGSIISAVIGVTDGDLVLTSGSGGKGGTGGKGGDGGAISNSNLASVNQGLFLFGGSGGAGGKAGGIGGGLTNIQVSTPQVGDGISAVLWAGDGGKGTGGLAPGGAGGNITSITDGKGINGVINLIQAGNGGDSVSGVAGRGGNVSTVKSVGFLGRPVYEDPTTPVRLGVFDELGNAQGVFAGRAGSGAFTGLNGSVSNVTARQIAAIAAAVDAGGIFGVAETVTNIKADLIGYDVDGDLSFDGNGLPNVGVPIDGFIMAKVISKITTAPGGPAFFF